MAFLDHQNQQLQKELRVEKLRRTEDLSRLLRSTFYLEAKLRSERNQINQKLIEKDNEILRLVRINRFLLKKCKCTEIEDFRKKLKCNNGDEINVIVGKEVLQCTECKKDFYGIEREDMSVQTVDKRVVLDGELVGSTLLISFIITFIACLVGIDTMRYTQVLFLMKFE